jgi:RHS repeat-associated protein
MMPNETKANDQMLHKPPSDVKGHAQDRDLAARPPMLQPLQANLGVTAMAGEVRTLDDQPLEGVTLHIGNLAAATDDSGRFLLISIPPGHHELLIDGRTASKPGQTYGIFEIEIDVTAGRTNVLPFTIWMPELDMANAVSIPSPTMDEVIVTTPKIPGFELRLAPGTSIRDRDGQRVTQVSITPIPVDRPPFPLPFGAEFPMYFTVQPGGAYIEPYGARIIYPNVTDEPPGTRINFWNYDPEGQGWYIYGRGTVSQDRKQVVPDEGVVIYELMGASIGAFDPAPAEGDEDDDGDPVDLGTGLFVLKKTDLILPDVLPVTLARTHRRGGVLQGARPFGIGSNHPYELFLLPDTQDQEVDLILPDGAKVHYTRISPADAEDNVVFQHSTTPSVFFRSRLNRIKRDFWELGLSDGMVYVFERVLPPQLTLMRDRYGNTIHIIRRQEEHGKVSKIISPNGRWLEFTVDEERIEHNVVQVRDNFGRVVTYGYDDKGRLTTVADPLGRVTEYTYESNQIRTIKDARGIVFLTNEYDEKGRVVKQTQADGSTYQFEYTVDDAGKIIKTVVVDPRGNIRRVTFNTDGYMLTDTRAVGTPEEQSITYERQPGTNLILSTTDALGRKTAYTYDAIGNETSITHLAETPEAVRTEFTYEPTFNQLTGVTDPLGHLTFTYDDKGNLTSVSDPMGNRTTFAYDGIGQPISITDALSNTIQLRYDLGQAATLTNALGDTTTRYVDSVGRPIIMTDALGRSTRYAYDAHNKLSEVVDALGGLTAFAYDVNGNLLTVTDALGNITSYTYDSMDRIASRTDPLERSESYQYDAAGNLGQFTDRKDQVTRFGYDSLNRLIEITYADGSRTSYTYDAANRLTRAADSLAGTIALTYDNLDRLIQVTTPQGIVGYTYDAAGHRTSMNASNQLTTTYAYDGANRLTQITQGSLRVGIAYDALDRQSRRILPGDAVLEYTYDGASQLTSIVYTVAGTVLGDLTYEYDVAGQRTTVGGSFARSNLPNEVTSLTYDAANQLTARNGISLSYDANGNLTSDGVLTYGWDARDRLVSIIGPEISASFQYDALGRRIIRTVNGNATEFLYDGLNVVQELSGGTVIANLLTGLSLDEYFARTDGDGAHSLLTDALGSTLAILDSAGGIRTEYTYEPFGRTAATGTTSANSLQYTGRENDGTGLYYLRARYYNPTLQRFIREDPLEFAGKDFNFYAYAFNNPLSYTDPLGLFSGDWAGDHEDGPTMGGRKDEGERMRKAVKDLNERNAEMVEDVVMMAGVGMGGLPKIPKAEVVNRPRNWRFWKRSPRQPPGPLGKSEWAKERLRTGKCKWQWPRWTRWR